MRISVFSLRQAQADVFVCSYRCSFFLCVLCNLCDLCVTIF